MLISGFHVLHSSILICFVRKLISEPSLYNNAPSTKHIIKKHLIELLFLRTLIMKAKIIVLDPAESILDINYFPSHSLSLRRVFI